MEHQSAHEDRTVALSLCGTNSTYKTQTVGQHTLPLIRLECASPTSRVHSTLLIGLLLLVVRLGVELLGEH
eukprot:6095703-Prymnesium_polylepis.1